MAYSELIKDFNRIRAYLRSFYVYGFWHRNEYDQKSARGYDNERRRVESWLGQYMTFSRDADGRRVFLSVDSRSIPEDPLFNAFRAKTFTDGDITLHFLLMDILPEETGLPISAIMRQLIDRLYEFDSLAQPDESTVRKKLREYIDLGLVCADKKGRETRYRRSTDTLDLEKWDAAAAFFSESAPLGVIGAYIQDKLSVRFPFFRFKHHYILNTLDSEVCSDLLDAISEHRLIIITSHRIKEEVLPMRICVSTQTGRQHLLAWSFQREQFYFSRIDRMDKVQICGVCREYAEIGQRFESFYPHVWGVSGNDAALLYHIEMTVAVDPDEKFIVHRLEREKRCGTVTQTDDTHWKFSADVYDPYEMIPWLRTFIGRITDLQCSDKEMVKRFWNDFGAMTANCGDPDETLS